MSQRAVVISQQTWQSFCENFPSAAQWLALELQLPLYRLPSLTPHGETLTFVLTQDKPLYDYSGTG
jgi:hypothetical protein